MALPKIGREELAQRIQRRATEIAQGERDSVSIPLPGIYVLRRPTGLLRIHWQLSDHQNTRGLRYIKVAAAEMSARFDVDAD